MGQKAFPPRFAGHTKGVESVRDMVRACLEKGVEYLTLFAFSSENWRRPQDEVSLLMQLFVKALQQEVERLHSNGVRLRIVGDLSRFDPALQQLIRQGEERTAGNERLTLTIAANYGGRWDILQAANRLAQACPDKLGQWQEEDLAPFLAMAYAPEPDLFIRTGASSASAISCSGSWPTRNSISPIPSGPNSIRPPWRPPLLPTSSGAPLRPYQRAARHRHQGELPCLRPGSSPPFSC